MSDWVAIRRRARQDIHAAFAVSAQYTDDVVIIPVPLAVRWHDKFTTAIGDIGGGEYARVFENIDKILFDPVELVARGLTPKRGGVVELIDYAWSFKLDVREPFDGPDKVQWTVMQP
jgi:hypothetical protein